jgi:hypothetical protein
MRLRRFKKTEDFETQDWKLLLQGTRDSSLPRLVGGRAPESSRDWKSRFLSLSRRRLWTAVIIHSSLFRHE